MASFSIVVTSPPLDSQGAYSAYRFIDAAIKTGHTVSGVFFYQAGVLNGSFFQSVLSDELDLAKKWQSLGEQFEIPLQVCVTAANRRGILSSEDVRENKDFADFNLKPPFISVGLGELITQINQADRTIQF